MKTKAYIMEDRKDGQVYLVVKEGLGSAYFPIYPYERHDIDEHAKPKVLTDEFDYIMPKKRR